ncbi:hypothetical protein L3073_17140 [Ancylomarina sp. DW003]|nr:hypothetical protein [Ancylomarina sp. DW003]MDE5423942.1 hypothetical protein [Ancylomarina sp. DW003]
MKKLHLGLTLCLCLLFAACGSDSDDTEDVKPKTDYREQMVGTYTGTLFYTRYNGSSISYSENSDTDLVISIDKTNPKSIIIGSYKGVNVTETTSALYFDLAPITIQVPEGAVPYPLDEETAALIGTGEVKYNNQEFSGKFEKESSSLKFYYAKYDDFNYTTEEHELTFWGRKI